VICERMTVCFVSPAVRGAQPEENMDTLRYYARAYAREPATKLATIERHAERTAEPTAGKSGFMLPSDRSPRAPGGRAGVACPREGKGRLRQTST
jgi:hypothetical protein